MQWRHTKHRHLCQAARIRVMLCCGRKKEGRDAAEMATSPRRQQQPGLQPPRAKDPPPMVIQGDFRKVSGISTEIFRLIEQVENEHDATTAAALDTVERRGEMVVRILDPRTLGRFSTEAAKRFLQLQDSKHIVQLVEIVKRPGQTLGLYIREGNGLERGDGVFISRIALESAVYNSGCLQVGDEILAVNLVDVTRMSLDDVVIIMSIPRRLVLATRQRKGVRGIPPGQSPLLPPRESKPPPVVVIKKHFEDLDQDENGIDDRGDRERERDRERDRQRERERERERERDRRPRSRLGLGLSQLSQEHGDHNGLDLYYNSRPADSSADQWTYRPPPPPVVTEQPKPQHFTPYDRQYPKTLESLAEKVHSFYPGGPLDDRRGSPAYRSIGPGSSLDSRRVGSRIMPRSGSDQHLPRVEYDYGSSRLGRHTGSLARPSSKANTLGHPGYTSRFGSDSSRGYAPTGSSSTALRDSNYSRRSRPALDYSSDTEATIGSRSSLGYYRRSAGGGSNVAGISGSTLSRVGTSSLRSNSLPRDRGRGFAGLSHQPFARFDRNLPVGLLGDDDSDGALSAPELPIKRDRGRIPNSPSVFTSDEYRAWLSRVPSSLLPRSTSSISHTGSQGLSGISRTPSTSAIYERIRAGRDAITQQRGQRFTFSAENINLLDRNLEDSPYYSFRSGNLSSTLDRPRPASTTPLTSSQSLIRSTDFRDKSNLLTSSADKNMRRMLQLMDLESRHIPNPTPRLQNDPRSRLVDINPAEFLKYKVDKPNLQNASSISSLPSQPEISSDLGAGLGAGRDGMYGLLWVHLLAGRGLRASTQSVGAAAMRDLYCVLECDRVHKARTVVRTGDIVFDWDETFELDLMGNRDLDLLIYSWDPQYRHKLCYKGSVHLVSLLKQSPVHQLALKIEPRGTLYLRLKYTDPQTTFQRKPCQQHILARPGSKPIHQGGLFGASLESVVNRENITIGGMASAQNNVPLLIKRCVEEIERRGLDIIGLYRLCGSATKKRILREALERGARTVDLTPDNVPDINVITGVLKDYLRELPEPLFTKCLYQMLVDVMSVCLPDDPEGNARLLFSILDCLPKVNRVTLVFLMDHLALVVSQSDRNKMTAQNISVIFGPILMLHAESGNELDFNQPVTVLRYLLEIWKHQSVRDLACPVSVGSDKPRPGPGGPGLSTPASGATKPTPPQPHPYTKPLPGVPVSKPQPGPVVVTSPGSPTSESSRSSSSMSPPEDSEILKGSKVSIANKNSKLVDSSSLGMISNKSPSQISLLGSMSSIANKSPSQISLLGSNSSISSLARSNASISDQAKVFRSPYGSPNLSDRSKSPYLQNLERSSPPDRRSPNLSNRDVIKSPNMRDITRSPLKMEQSKPTTIPTSLTSGQICDNPSTEPKPMFSTLPRQRSIPTIIGMPRRLSEPRKSLPQVQSTSDEFSQDIPKNPFEKVEDFTIPVNPTGKNPFLDEDEIIDSYAYDSVMNRVMSYEQHKNGPETSNAGQMFQTTIGQYGSVVTTSVANSQRYANPIMNLQYSVPINSGKPTDIPPRPPYDPHRMAEMNVNRPGTIREEVSETPTPTSSTGTDSSRKDIGRDGDVDSDVESDDDIEIAEQADVVPELGGKHF